MLLNNIPLTVKVVDKLILRLKSGPESETKPLKALRRYRNNPHDNELREDALKMFATLPEARQTEILRAASLT